MNIIEDHFNMHYYSPVVEPGLKEGDLDPGAAMAAGDIAWSSPTQGRMAVGMWTRKAVITFDVSRGTGAITDVDLGKRGQPGGGGADVWRQMHGYRLGGRDYFWKAILEKSDEPMDAAVGAGYDEVISGVWRLWAKRSLDAKLSRAPVAGFPALGGGAGDAELDKPIAMTYDDAGLVGRASGDYIIRIWHIPVRVRFSVEKAQPNDDSDWIIELADLSAEYGKYKDAWRQRYGYSRSAAGDYAWDADFPDPKPDIRVFGPKLEEMMDRCVKFWAEGSVSTIMQGLDAQLKAAMARAKVSAAGTQPGQAQSTLTGIQNQGAWPR